METNFSGKFPFNHEAANYQAHEIRRRFHDVGHDIPIWLAREAVSVVHGYRDWSEMYADLNAIETDCTVALNKNPRDNVSSILENGSAYHILGLLSDKLEANPAWSLAYLGHSTGFLFALTNALVYLRDRGDISITPDTIRHYLSLPRFNDLVFQFLATRPALPINRPIYAFTKKWRYFETGTTTKKAKASHQFMEEMVRAATYLLDEQVANENDGLAPVYL